MQSVGGLRLQLGVFAHGGGDGEGGRLGGVGGGVGGGGGGRGGGGRVGNNSDVLLVCSAELIFDTDPYSLVLSKSFIGPTHFGPLFLQVRWNPQPHILHLSVVRESDLL